MNIKSSKHRSAKESARGLRWLALSAVGALALGSVIASPASAGSWPGNNGEIVFTLIPDSARQIEQQLYIVDPSGNNPQQLTVGEGERIAANPSPDGKHMVYTLRDPATDTYSTKVLKVDSSGASDIREVPIEDSDESFTASFSPTGKELVVTKVRDLAGQMTFQLVVVNLAGKVQRVLPEPNNVPANYQPVFAQWSPEGDWISFIDQRRRAYRVAADGSMPPERLIPLPNAEIENLSWSPDGRNLLFTAGENNGQPDLWTMSRNGTNPQQLTDTPNVPESHASWAPDGTKIVYSTFEPGSNLPIIQTMNSDGSDPRTISPPGQISLYPTWLPVPVNTTLKVKAVKKSKKLKVGATYKLVKSADTNGQITKVKVVCKTQGKKVTGKKAQKAVCGAKEKKKKDPTTTKIVTKPKCDSKVQIKAVITAEYPNADPLKWKRTWKVKNNTGPTCAN